ncbi:Response regulator receiver domain-containing protein [Marinospirillum celere]|uniref:Response regulator receiver domain-containing protein n=1 Tax=Marinospirillum celere TaxID=1122252 RepID=A0A1I1JCH3_9GAMM|nr:response regulator [Marinospirillum celere]SFC44318.1 Response regulator receiver domain-containing protein [Marinospirillum celere]
MGRNEHKFCVLLVEDEPADAHLVKISFEEGRLLVDLQQVQDGVEALEYLRRTGRFAEARRPDLILLDLNMPRMNGRQFLEKVKQDENLKSIPVVVLTTSEAETDIISSYDLGASGYIVKPVDINDFIEQVQQLENYWFSLVKRPAG